MFYGRRYSALRNVPSDIEEEAKALILSRLSFPVSLVYGLERVRRYISASY